MGWERDGVGAATFWGQGESKGALSKEAVICQSQRSALIRRVSVWCGMERSTVARSARTAREWLRSGVIASIRGVQGIRVVG